MVKATSGEMYDRQHPVDARDELPSDEAYSEPTSVFISDEWDVISEDFLDDFDDFGDINFPHVDDDY